MRFGFARSVSDIDSACGNSALALSCLLHDKLPVAFLLSLAISANAVETKPVEVLSILNGLTIRVKADVGGQPFPVAVRLSYIILADPIGTDDLTAHAEDMPSTVKLKELLPIGSLVTLQCAQERFAADETGRMQAVVCLDDMTADNRQRRRCIQEEMIKSGWARFQPRDQPDFYSLFRILQAAEQDAQAGKRGIWE